MLQLSNGCWCSDFNVYPENWERLGASCRKDWYITYWFHDPAYKDHPQLKKGKLIMVKGMNRAKSLAERRQLTKAIMLLEEKQLRDGYNPITRAYTEKEEEAEISPNTPLMDALRKSLERLQLVKRTKDDIAGTLGYIEQAAGDLAFVVDGVRVRCAQMQIKDVKRKHLRLLLDKCGEIKTTWTAATFNNYRKYLSMLYTELEELEAVEVNPVKGIKKQKTVKKIRETLSPEQRIMVNEHLYNNYPDFWRFAHIFFHSGCRETEIMQVRKEDVHLKAQLFKITIIKGKSRREVTKVIKDTALPLWRQLMSEAKDGDYLFSEGLKPGHTAINPVQITRRWYWLVKKKLGITADFYSLKHTNSDETSAMLDLQAAADMNSHTSTVITMEHYAQGEKNRQQEKLKKVNNKFA